MVVMTKNISRRSFIKKGTALGAASIIGRGLLPNLAEGNTKMTEEKGKVDISVVTGSNYYENTIKAVAQLGGMQKFVPKNSIVAILPNAQRKNPGAFTKPDVVKAVIRMCKEAGAQKINCLSWLPEEAWKLTGLDTVIKAEDANLVLVDGKDETRFKAVSMPKGVALKEARIMKEFYKNDVFINIPVTKDHLGNKFTGTLKNLMGLNSPGNNRTFHKINWTTDINDITHLEQCIADLNTIVAPDLCIVDATEFIITNGPFGPGKLHKPQKVVAGTDRVAIDAYCCQLWGLKPEKIISINKAYELNLGEIRLDKVTIKELKA